MKRVSKFVFSRMAASSTTESTSSEGSLVKKIRDGANHDQVKYPFIKALEQGLTGSLGMGYMGGNHHMDSHHFVDWGLGIFKHLEEPKNNDNELFNSGYRVIFDLEDMKCPGGNKIK